MSDSARRVALVTGASRGIGRALVDHLIGEGWWVAALARDAQGLAHQAAAAPHGRLLPLVADVTDAATMLRAGEELRRHWRAPDLVVANAGIFGPAGPTDQVDPTAFQRTLAVNVGGVVTTLHAVLPAMVGRRVGRVVVMASGMGRKPTPWCAAYGASKAAVIQLVSSVDAELTGTGVHVFAISPGMVRTEMTRWPAELVAHDPSLRDQPDSDFLPASRAAELVSDLASGRLDALAGTFVHVRDDLDSLLAATGG